MPDPVLITGSAGFIGSHVRELLANGNGEGVACLDLTAVPARTTFRADVTRPRDLHHAASVVRPRAVVHLAARAEVALPFEDLGDLMTTNVNGTINVVDAMRPERIVLASSSSVYGNASGRRARPRWSCVNPVGAYGMSKAAAELACAEWARQRGAVAVSLRIGNVVGRRCRGLIPYLVDHAVAYPRAERPAQLRGGGNLVRDYVPIAHVTRAIQRATEMSLPPGSFVMLNVGSGRGLTNRSVASVVQHALASQGLKLAMVFGSPRASGEVERVVLDTATSNETLALPGPTEDDVIAAIQEATLDHLARTADARHPDADASLALDRPV